MSNLVKQSVNLISIPEDATVSIEVSGYFYQRFNKLLIEYADMQGKDNLLKAMLLIKQQKSQEMTFAFNLETLMILGAAIETAYKEAGLTKDNLVEIEIPQDVHSYINKSDKG